ncbi:MAG: single-stranded DNA-binding protein [Bacillota bacterium]|nr:single-stranded DNA-binding protein [Bacillota bacterium]
METGYETNRAELSGTILTAPAVSHKSYGEVFYVFLLGVERRSGCQDQIPLLVSERLMWGLPVCVGRRASVLGQVRTYNENEGGRNRLHVVLFAREFRLQESAFAEEDANRVELEGFLCKAPIRRTSPMGREICDLMLAVNRMYGKSDYIPCIAWGRNALYCGNLQVGNRLCLTGRLQSREYRKKEEGGAVSLRTAYEVSILKLEE